MRRRKCIYITILVLFLLFVAGAVYYYLPKERCEIGERYGGSTLERIEWMGVAPDGVSTCLVEYGRNPCYPIVPGKYIVYEDMDAYKKSYYFGDDYLGLEYVYDEYILYTIDIVTGQRRDLYDINELNMQFPEVQVTSNVVGIYQWEGEDVCAVHIYERPKETNNYGKLLYINLEDGSYEFHDSLPDCIIESPLSNIGYRWHDYDLLGENFSQKWIEETHILGYENYEGVYRISTRAQHLPQNNETLYTMFPELEQYRGEEDCYVYMLIGGDPSAEELLRLLMEDDQEISFEGAVLSAEQSIDGEMHEIHSFEDFERWFADEE